MKYKLLILSFLLLTTIVKAQTWESIDNKEALKVLLNLNKTMDALNNYSVDVLHTAYKGYKSTIQAETYKGYYRKLGNAYESNLLGVRTIQDDKYSVTIDSADKMIILSNPVNKSLTDKIGPNAIKTCKEIKCVRQNNRVTALKLVFMEGSPFTRIDIYWDEAEFINKLVIYNSAKIKWDDNDTISVQPRVEIVMQNYQLNTNKKADFDTGQIIQYSNKIFTFQKEYEAYKLSDHRIKQ